MSTKQLQSREDFTLKLAKGAKGEQVVIERLRAITEVQDLTDYQAYRKYQRKGLDFMFKDRKTGAWLRGDSKANIMGGTESNLGVTFMELYNKKGSEGWFKTSKSDFIFIYDVKTGRSYFYDLDEMRKLFNTKQSNNELTIKTVQDGSYGVWWPVAHPLIKELK